MCILLNVKKHEKTFALNVDIFSNGSFFKKYFILRGQNAIIVSKDYSRTRGRISGDICVFGHGFLFI